MDGPQPLRRLVALAFVARGVAGTEVVEAQHGKAGGGELLGKPAQRAMPADLFAPVGRAQQHCGVERDAFWHMPPAEHRRIGVAEVQRCGLSGHEEPAR
jgi:hypothetical protein